MACCDAMFHPLLTDLTGVPLALGRTTRFATPVLRRAVHQRDGGCIFPGCDAPPNWTDLHHVVHWNQGGTTDPQNLASLCRHHHGTVHRTGWSLTTTPDQWFTITTPTGRTLHSQRHGRNPPTEQE